MQSPFETATAIFSEDRKSRFWLRRTWDWTKPPLLGFLINPSIADAVKNDPTTTIMSNLAENNGYGSWCAMNTNPCVSTNPNHMDDVSDAHLIRNTKIIYQAVKWAENKGGKILLAWGDTGVKRNQHLPIVQNLKARNIKPLCIGVTKSGNPRFPRAIPYNTKFKEFHLE